MPIRTPIWGFELEAVPSTARIPPGWRLPHNRAQMWDTGRHGRAHVVLVLGPSLPVEFCQCCQAGYPRSVLHTCLFGQCVLLPCPIHSVSPSNILSTYSVVLLESASGCCLQLRVLMGLAEMTLFRSKLPEEFVCNLPTQVSCPLAGFQAAASVGHFCSLLPAPKGSGLQGAHA